MGDDAKALFDLLREAVLALGDDVTERFMNQYVGYRRQKNFTEIVGLKKTLNVFIDGPVQDHDGIGEDVSNIGHWGTGNLRVKVTTEDDVEKVLTLIEQAYKLQQ
jgi:predicted transport protein